MKVCRRWPIMLLAALLLASLCACTAASGQKEVKAVFTDDRGREVSLSSWERVAAPQSSFADLWQLAGGTVFATSEETFSEGVVTLDEGTVNLGSVHTPSAETMIEQGVDFAILTANLSEHIQMEETLEAAGIRCAYFDVETFEDYLRVLKTLTSLTGREDLYRENGEEIQARVEAAIARSQGHEAPSVLYIRAYSSGAKAKGSDNLAGAMLKDMGCINLADSDQSLLEDLSMEVIIDRDPDFIFVTTMGASSEAALQAIADTLQANPAWAELSAVKNGRYIVLPKELFHLKPNKRWGESYEMLADLLYGAQD